MSRAIAVAAAAGALWLFVGFPLSVACFRPVLRRLALRNAARRPRETVLVLLGALLGTAIITGSSIVGDTLGASIRRSAYTQLGPVDQLVQASGFESGQRAREAVARVESAFIDGVLPLTTIAAAVAAPGAGPEAARAEPQAQVLEVDFATARRFGTDPEATGISGATPGPGEAAMGRDLARSLRVGPGSTVDVYAYGQKRTLRVVRVLPRLGVAGFHLGFGSESPNLFVAPGTIAELVEASGGTAGSPPAVFVAVSNRGGVLEGADHSEVVRPLLEASLAGVPASVLDAKRELLRAADENGQQFTELFTSIGFFSVLAGILLLVNIFVMLAQERKTELGMLRAVGMRRSALVASFSFEGWLYAVVSSALGAVAGLGVGRLIVLVAAGIFATGADGSAGLELQYTATLPSVLRSFGLGFAMSVLTVYMTSLAVARLNVIRAIRDLPEPSTVKQRTAVAGLGTLATVLGGVMTAGGLAADDATRVLAGPAVLALGLVGVLRRVVPRRPLVTVASLGVLVWALVCFDVVEEAFRGAEIVVFVVDGIVLTSAAVALVTANQDVIGGFLRKLGGGSRNMAMRLGLAYPLAKRFRTGMILTMYSLVVFTLASITLFSDVFSTQIDDFTRDLRGGFDLRVTSNPANHLTEEVLRQMPGVTKVASLSTVAAQFALTSGADREFDFWPATGFGPDLVAGGVPALEERPARFADDEAVFRELLRDPDAVVVDPFFLQVGGGPPEQAVRPGDTIVIKDPSSGRTRELTVLALSQAGPDSSQVLLSLDALRAVVGERAVPTQHYVGVAPGVDPQDLAEELSGRFLANGAAAISFRKWVTEGLTQQRQFFRLMQGYLALGLVVGIAGLGVVMVRAVRERRRQVGVLRALGFQPGSVRRAFVTESGFVALEGILIGVTLAMLTTWRILTTGAFGEGLEFRVPWLQMAMLVSLTFAASLLATVAPAQQASRIRPAVALRIAD